jgi:SagB-type dehydrogenase family enzyme
MRLLASPNALAEEYHVASANLASRRASPRAHEINLDEDVQEMVRTAPLQLDGRSRVALPRDDAPLGDLGELIPARRSVRSFAREPIGAAQLGRILYLANGIQTHAEGGGRRRNAPNAGGLGSAEIYCFAERVEGVEPGIYHFDAVRHDLALLRAGRFESWLREFALSQAEYAEAAALLVVTSAMGRLMSKYGPRGYRLGLLDAGHVSQNAQLVAAALGLAASALSGFVDAELNRALELDGLERCAVLALGIGRPGH